MSDSLPDTPPVTTPYCPGCSPDISPFDLVHILYCRDHEPSHDGAEDAKVAPTFLSGTAEASADECRRMQRLIR